MGRLASDVMALACIAGGAVVGAGVTAGLMASTDAGERVGHVVCADAVDAPTVVVRLGSGSAYVATRSARVGSAHDGCSASARVHVVEAKQVAVEARARADAARARAREARLRADEVRLQADEIRLRVDEMRLQADRLGAEGEAVTVDVAQLREAAGAEALEAVERQLEEAQRRWAESGLEGRALTEALENLRRSLRESVESGGND